MSLLRGKNTVDALSHVPFSAWAKKMIGMDVSAVWQGSRIWNNIGFQRLQKWTFTTTAHKSGKSVCSCCCPKEERTLGTRLIFNGNLRELYFADFTWKRTKPKIFFSLKWIFAPVRNALWPFLPFSKKSIHFICIKTCEKPSIFCSRPSQKGSGSTPDLTSQTDLHGINSL